MSDKLSDKLNKTIEDFLRNVQLVQKYEDDFYPIEIDVPDDDIKVLFEQYLVNENYTFSYVLKQTLNGEQLLLECLRKCSN